MSDNITYLNISYNIKISYIGKKTIELQDQKLANKDLEISALKENLEHCASLHVGMPPCGLPLNINQNHSHWNQFITMIWQSG